MAKNEKPEETNHKADDEVTEAVKPNEQPELEAESKEKPAEEIEEPSQDVKETKVVPVVGSTSKLQKLKTFIRTKKGKIVASIAALVVVIGVLSLIPSTRYAIAGAILKKDVSIKVVDQTTQKKVSEATVRLAGKTAKTDKEGVAKFSSVPVGEYKLTVEKKYYKNSSASYVVPIIAKPSNDPLKISATGRQVTVTVTNKISKKPLEKATVEFSGAAATTDNKGQATLVLPASIKAYEGKVKAENYNDQSISIVVEDKDDQRAAFEITPSGKIFFLSKRSGTIDVMKANLDGSNSKVVLGGTGEEESGSTVLLASRDWKHLVLYARRDGDRAKIYYINSDTGELKTVDEGNANFQLVGWSNNHFIYHVERLGIPSFRNKAKALKSFDANTGRLITIDETYGEGNDNWEYQAEYISNISILKNEIIYTKEWQYGERYRYGWSAEKKMAIMSVKANGERKTRIKEFPDFSSSYISSILYAPEEIYFRLSDSNDKPVFYELENGKVSQATDLNENKWNNTYNTYLISPSDNRALWTEPRDGKAALFIGGSQAEEKKQMGLLASGFVAFGWYTDEYILLSKESSELYIASARDVLDEVNAPIKITDYHKPYYSYYGYGRGYGGQ